ncbi:MAG: CHASE3 domain-containing protein [Chthoniobacteraceae bacterium]
MKWNVGTKIGAGFTVVLVIFLLVGLSYQNILELKGAEEWQKHTYIVLRELDGIYSRLESVESGQRGYVISGDDSDLEPYQTALGQIDGTLRDLRSLTADNPSQQQRLDSLEPEIKARLDVAKVVEARGTGGADAATQAMKITNTRGMMDGILSIIQAMQNEEESLLKTRSETVDSDSAGPR